MLYAIGDIHGMYNELVNLYQKILDHSKDFSGPHTIIFLGDYIDRGLYSKKVIDFLNQDPPSNFKHIYLKGNHEDMFLNTMNYVEGSVNDFGDYYSGNAVHLWLQNGGETTAFSYECVLMDFFTDPVKIRMNMNSLAVFIRNKTQISYREGNFFFVHAGVDPRMDISKNKENTFLWIREEFLNYEGSFYLDGDPVIVVHGHTILKDGKIDIRPNRVNIDTFAFRTKILSAIAIEDDKIIKKLTSENRKN